MLNIIQALVARWHETAEAHFGRDKVLTSRGHGPLLLFFARRLSNGDIEVCTMSAKDYFSTHTIEDLQQGPAVGEPSIPFIRLNLSDLPEESWRI